MTVHHYRLGDLTTKIGSGATPRGGTKVYQATGVAFIRSQNVLDWGMKLEDIARLDPESARQLDGVSVEPGDVLINITGDSIARCAVVDPSILPARVSQHVSILRPNHLINSTYLMCALLNPEMKLRLLTESAGGTRNALTKTQLAELRIPLPPLAEQNAIAAVLGALDDKIANNTALAATAGHLAIVQATTAPSTCSLGDVARLDRTTINPTSLAIDRIPHYSLPAFDAGVTPASDSPADIKSSKFWVATPRVLMSKLNPRIPRTWAIDETTGLPGLASTEFMPLVSETVSYRVLWAAVSDPEFGRRLEAQVAGTSGSHQRVRPEDLLSTEIVDPRLLSGRTTDAIESLVSVSIQARSESGTLRELRDTLLPALMSGRLRVKDAERQVEDAV